MPQFRFFVKVFQNNFLGAYSVSCGSGALAPIAFRTLSSWPGWLGYPRRGAGKGAFGFGATYCKASQMLRFWPLFFCQLTGTLMRRTAWMAVTSTA